MGNSLNFQQLQDEPEELTPGEALVLGIVYIKCPICQHENVRSMGERIDRDACDVCFTELKQRRAV